MQEIFQTWGVEGGTLYVYKILVCGLLRRNLTELTVDTKLNEVS
jgi:hypothetical protein